MNPFATVLCALSLATAVPCQGLLSFPLGLAPGVNGFAFHGEPNALVVLAVSFSSGPTAVRLGPGLVCRLVVGPDFVVLPLGITDAQGLLSGSTMLPSSQPAFVVQAVACPLPPTLPQLMPSNAVYYFFQGCWGGGAGIGG